MDDEAILAVVGDTHTNSTPGILPTYIELKDRIHKSNKVQRWQWRCWLEFWDWVEALKTEYGYPLVVVGNGDLVDDPHHATVQVISQHKIDIKRLAVAVWDRPAQLADYLFIVRGTEAHSGLSGWYEEWLASDLTNAVQFSKTEYSWPDLDLALGGVSFHLQHHPRTRGMRPWTEQAAPSRQSEILKDEYIQSDRWPPDVGIYSHVHYPADSGVKTKPRVFYTHPWQLTTTYGHRIGVGNSIRPLGGYVFICNGGEYTVKIKEFKLKRRRPWTMPKSKS